MSEHLLKPPPSPSVPPPADAVQSPDRGQYDGTTYYGRPALKPAPFENWVVGGYIFLAGLSGAAQIIATLADLTGVRRGEGLVRRGRWLSMLAPTLGSALLIYDLHTPKRFYNMLRIAKRTSPMSIGTWILMGFSGFAGVTTGLQALGDWLRPRRGRRTDRSFPSAALSERPAPALVGRAQDLAASWWAGSRTPTGRSQDRAATRGSGDRAAARRSADHAAARGAGDRAAAHRVRSRVAARWPGDRAVADPVRYRVSAAGAGDRAATDHWTDRVARITQLPAAIAGAGLSTYTASLLSATSTPFWAGAPESLAVRFGSSSVAAGAAALSLGERREGNHRLARDLDLITLAALSAELAATVRSESVLHRKGVSAAEDGAPVTQNLALLGTVLPIGLHLAALAVGRRGSVLSQLASVATLAGSLCLRVGVLEAGDESVRRPQDGFRLAKPHNLPRP